MSLRRLHKRISIHIHTVTFQTDKCRYSRSPNSKDRKHEQRACEMKYKCRDWPSFEANPFISSYSWDVSSWVFLRDLKLKIPQTEPIPFSQASVPSSSFHIPGQSWLGPAGHRILPFRLFSCILLVAQSCRGEILGIRSPNHCSNSVWKQVRNNDAWAPSLFRMSIFGAGTSNLWCNKPSMYSGDALNWPCLLAL